MCHEALGDASVSPSTRISTTLYFPFPKRYKQRTHAMRCILLSETRLLFIVWYENVFEEKN